MQPSRRRPAPEARVQDEIPGLRPKTSFTPMHLGGTPLHLLECSEISSLLDQISKTLRRLPDLGGDAGVDIHLCARLLAEIAQRDCPSSRTGLQPDVR
jgi:hypothetical protein